MDRQQIVWTKTSADKCTQWHTIGFSQTQLYARIIHSSMKADEVYVCMYQCRCQSHLNAIWKKCAGVEMVEALERNKMT